MDFRIEVFNPNIRLILDRLLNSIVDRLETGYIEGLQILLLDPAHGPKRINDFRPFRKDTYIPVFGIAGGKVDRILYPGPIILKIFGTKGRTGSSATTENQIIEEIVNQMIFHLLETIIYIEGMQPVTQFLHLFVSQVGQTPGAFQRKNDLSQIRFRRYGISVVILYAQFRKSTDAVPYDGLFCISPLFHRGLQGLEKRRRGFNVDFRIRYDLQFIWDPVHNDGFPPGSIFAEPAKFLTTVTSQFQQGSQRDLLDTWNLQRNRNIRKPGVPLNQFPVFEKEFGILLQKIVVFPMLGYGMHFFRSHRSFKFNTIL